MRNDESIEVAKRPDDAEDFVVIAKRLMVERKFAWLNRCRRLANDWDASIESAEA